MKHVALKGNGLFQPVVQIHFSVAGMGFISSEWQNVDICRQYGYFYPKIVTV